MWNRALRQFKASGNCKFEREERQRERERESIALIVENGKAKKIISEIHEAQESSVIHYSLTFPEQNRKW